MFGSLEYDVCEPCGTMGFTKEYGVVFPGKVENTLTAYSWDDCARSCDEDEKCVVFAFNEPNICELKYKFELSARQPTNGTISGRSCKFHPDCSGKKMEIILLEILHYV